MSPWPTEHAGPLAITRAWPQAGNWARHFRRHLDRSLGRLPLHTLYLGAQSLQAWPVDAAARQGAGPEPFADLEDWCHAHPGSDVRLVLSGHWLHGLVVDPAITLPDDSAARDYVRQQFVHYHGAAARQWPLAVWRDATQAGACAMHGLDLAALQSRAAIHEVQLRSVVPAWSTGLASVARHVPRFAGAGRSALALVESTLVTWLVVQAGALVALQQRYLDAPQTALLAEMIDMLVAETGPFADEPLLAGWSIEDREERAALPAHAVTPLQGWAGAAAWLFDRVGPTA